MKKKLSAAETMIIKLVESDTDNYSLYQCEEHGVYAHRIDDEYTGCLYCKKKTEPKTVEELCQQ